MRPAEYTNEQIIKTGKNLLDAGKRVTPFGIRNALGGGNTRRIRGIWEQYLAGKVDEALHEDAHIELPAEFAEQLDGMSTALLNYLTALAKQLYRRADEITEHRTREGLQAAKQAQEQAEATIAEAEQTIEQQDQTRADIEARLATLQEEHQAALISISRLKGDREMLKKEIDHEQATHQRLTKEKSALRKLIDDKTHQFASVKAELDIKNEALNSLEKETNDCRTKIEDLHEDKASAMIELGELRADNANLNKQLRAAQLETAELRKSESEHLTEIGRLQGEIESLKLIVDKAG